MGTPTLGGPVVTDGGLLFIGSTMDNLLRAFDVDTGAALWAGELPFGGHATPMTYAVGGRQYVVIAAGGHPVLGSTVGDAVVAFALPQR
jgi:quinoprotein glucose dehydrogenase